MKMITILLCTLVACGGGAKKSSETAGSAASTGDGTPCTQEVALVCPEGQIDACVKAVAEEPEEKDKPDDGAEESGGSGTAMALEEGNMGKLAAAGNHRCVPK